VNCETHLQDAYKLQASNFATACVKYVTVCSYTKKVMLQNHFLQR